MHSRRAIFLRQFFCHLQWKLFQQRVFTKKSLERKFSSSFFPQHKEKAFFDVSQQHSVWPIGARSCAKAAAMKRDGKSKEEGKNIFGACIGMRWSLPGNFFCARTSCSAIKFSLWPSQYAFNIRNNHNHIFLLQ